MQNAYTTAIDALRGTLVQRSRRYKWLVIVVCLAAVASAGAALTLGSALPLLAGLALPALATAFFALDLHAVQRWRCEVLQAWATDELQLELLLPTLQKLPHLPAQTVAGMLETLPPWPTHLPAQQRGALLSAQAMLANVALQSMVVRAMALALVAAAVVAAVIASCASWLLAAGSAPVLWIGWWLASRWRVRHRLSIKEDAVALNWQGVPASFRN